MHFSIEIALLGSFQDSFVGSCHNDRQIIFLQTEAEGHYSSTFLHIHLDFRFVWLAVTICTFLFSVCISYPAIYCHAHYCARFSICRACGVSLKRNFTFVCFPIYIRVQLAQCLADNQTCHFLQQGNASPKLFTLCYHLNSLLAHFLPFLIVLGAALLNTVLFF